ncbi:MAG: GFA family protein [Candidatus Competibacteraceae bacterium]|nr:GFA family protein [Candidatus Competibacteraceae bacterium]
MSEASIQGSCLCGAVGFEIRAPFLFFQYCHCGRCRKSSGSSHGANLLLKANQFGWIRGENHVRRYELPTAEYFCNGFCDICGSSLPWRARNGKLFVVPAGALDDDPGVTPTRNIFWDSRACWCRSAADLPTFSAEA